MARASQFRYRQLNYITCLLLAALPALAQEAGSAGGTKILPGISIVGNSETPKSLIIVPWRSARIARETKILPSPLNEQLRPVDKDSFMRQLEFYKLGNPE